MILRALFWIAVVSFFLPREPDLGLGRPGAQESGVGRLLSGVGSAAEQSAAGCNTAHGLCAAGASLFSAFQGIAVQSLDEVKADIDNSRHRHPAAD